MEIVQIVLEQWLKYYEKQWLKYYEKFDPFVQKCFEKGINENSLKAAFIGVANQRDNLRELLIKKGIDIEKGLKEIEEETKVVMKMGNAPVV